MQSFAEGECKDFRDKGVSPPAKIRRLANAGSGGACPKNVARDVQRAFSDECDQCGVVPAGGSIVGRALSLYFTARCTEPSVFF